jgi:acyl-CoA reductase-like NAD-dependent aldehyde dehydrogenase
LSDRISISIESVDFAAFMGPVINASAFEKIVGYIDLARTADHAVTSIIAGGKCTSALVVLLVIVYLL